MQDKSQTRVSCPHGSVPGRDERAVGVIHAQRGRGRSARTPSEIPERGWKDILLRIWKNIGRDRVVVVAAGVTFYSILAVFPAIACGNEIARRCSQFGLQRIGKAWPR